MAYTSDNMLKSIDWITICIYLALVIFGWFSVCGASYDYGEIDFFSFDTRAGDDEDFAGLFSWLRIQISYICILIIYFDVPIGTGSKPTDISTFLRTPLRGVVGVGRIEKGPRSCDRSPKSAGKRSWYRDE